MGFLNKLFGKRKEDMRSEENQQPEGDMANQDSILGFALLREAGFDMNGLAERIKAEFGPDTETEFSGGNLSSLAIQADGIQFMCTLMPFPVPDKEVDNLIPYNMLPADSADVFKEHQAFLVTACRGFDMGQKCEVCLRYNRLCGAVMETEQAAGMYMGGAGLLISREAYLKHVEIIRSPIGQDKAYFPAPLWIRVFLYMDGEKKMARTDGLKNFGFPDVCFYHTHQDPGFLYQQLNMIAIEEITGRGVYRNGDIIHMDGKMEAICKLSGDVLNIIGT